MVNIMTRYPVRLLPAKLLKSLQLTLFCGLLTLLSLPLTAQDLDVPYVPTPSKVVSRMLDIANVQPSDYVIDLGSGDGRIVIAAAKRGASGHGIDLDPDRVAEARRKGANEGVDNNIMFIKGDIFKTDFSKASVITMYLLPSVNKKLRPKLLNNLEPGTEIVSHSFDMGNWKADKQVAVNIEGKPRTHNIYYWVIPAKAEGRWHWNTGDRNFTMEISQQFQEIQVSLSDHNGNSYRIQKAQLQGKRLTVRATHKNNNYIFSGRIEENKITGIVQRHTGGKKDLFSWSASTR